MGYPHSQSPWGLALLFSLSGVFVNFSEKAYAGAFAVTPVRVTLSARHMSDSLVLTNKNDSETSVQLELFAWSQDGEGKDVFTPTKDLLATPPIFTLQPNGTQVVRVGLRRPQNSTDELTYRLFLQELPPPPKPNFTGLQVALRMGIPVFVLPANPVTPALTWQLLSSVDGKLILKASNAGKAHIQVANFIIAPQEATPFARQQVASYLLSNQTREWVVKNNTLSVGAKAHLTIETDVGEIQTDLIVE